MGLRSLRLDLEYDGADFGGWAAQPDRRTVEGALRAALARLIPEGYELAVAGRTDAGVHAIAQVASVATRSDIAPERLRRALGGLLPPDVVATRVIEADQGFDARRDALARRYEYRVLPGAISPLRRRRVLHHPAPLDRDALRSAAEHAVGRHDFRAFTPTQSSHTMFHRTLSRCAWVDRGDEIVLEVEGDAFLRHMIRVLVGTMLLVGRRSWEPEQIEPLLKGAPRGAAGPTAPAHPLTLVGVTY